ncbi:MAG: HNH endonuclease [Patescibacteria group bacterium]|nr:HNH endonuclease [Patescibacteria group bacterium]
MIRKVCIRKAYSIMKKGSKGMPADHCCNSGVCLIHTSPEIWVKIPEFEDFYEISNRGRIKSLARFFHWTRYGNCYKTWMEEKMLSPHLSDITGYLYVGLSIGKGKCRLCAVHQLVTLAFLGPRPHNMECRHFPDRDKTHNCLENLSYATHAENMADTIVHGTTTRGRSFNQGESHGSAVFTEEEVRKVRQLYASGDYTQEQLGEMFDVHQGYISRIIRREIWAHVH